MYPIVHSVAVKDSYTFFPVGCLHWPVGSKELLRQWVEDVRTTPNSFALLVGDSTDAVRTHYRDFLKTYTADENSKAQLDTWMAQDVESLAQELAPIKDRLLGTILGNHFWTFSEGYNSEQLLAQKLGIPYLGPTGIIRVDIKGNKKVLHRITIWAHHHGGSKGGKTVGSDAGALEKAEGNFEADIYTLSHTHRRLAYKVPKLGLTDDRKPKVVERTKVFVRTGAFLKGYNQYQPSTTKQDFPSYAELEAYRPTDLGYVKVKISLDGKRLAYQVSY